MDAAIRVGILSAVTVTVPATLATLGVTPGGYLMLFSIALFCASMAFGAAATALQLVTPGHLRAQVSAVYLLVLNLFAFGLAPLFTALITDYGFQRDSAVGNSMAIVSAICGPVGALCLWWCCAPFRQLARGA